MELQRITIHLEPLMARRDRRQSLDVTQRSWSWGRRCTDESRGHACRWPEVKAANLHQCFPYTHYQPRERHKAELSRMTKSVSRKKSLDMAGYEICLLIFTVSHLRNGRSPHQLKALVQAMEIICQKVKD